MKRILVSVSSTEVIATVVRGRQMAPCKRFDNDARGWQTFGLWLAENRYPVAIIVDAVEEDYRTEILPHTRGATRKQLLERKIKQHYRNTPYTTSIQQGRESEGRRDDRYLFAALTNPDLLEPWLAEIERNALPLCGVYLTPLVSRTLVRMLGAGDKPVLIVSQRRTGLRQSFFDRGELKLSRLTSIDASQPRTGYAEEILKTRAYLTSLRLIARDAQLNVLLLDSDGSLGELARALEEDLGVISERIGPAALEKTVRSEPGVLADCPEAVHFLLFLRARGAGNLAPPALLHRFHIYRARRGIFALSAAILIAATLFSLAQLKQRSALDAQTAALADAIRAQQRLYAAAARGFPAAPAPAGVLQSAVELSLSVQNQMRTPALALTVAAAALDRHPYIFVKKLHWSSGAKKTLQSGSDATARESLEIAAELQPFDGDFRAALAKVQRFATDLKDDPRVAEVRVVESPLDVSSQASLSGSAAAGRNPSSAAFLLLLELRAH